MAGWFQDGFKHWMVNEGPKALFMILWMVGNITVFAHTFVYYRDDHKFVCVRSVVHYGLPTARASAAIISYNSALILIPVCRNLISFVRGHVKSSVVRLLDKNLRFHKICAWTILIFAISHTGAHLENFYNLANNPTVGLCGVPAGTTMEDIMWTTVAGATGQILLIVMFLMYSSSMEIIRHSFFEVFWFTHHLFVVFFILLCVHGAGGLIKAGTNCTDYNDMTTCTYKGGGPKYWMWVVGPLGLYVLERSVRFWRSQQETIVSKVIQHPSKVIEIQIKKRGFHAEPGQYIFVHCPKISPLEWHPFTLTSAPEEDFCSVHIRVVGDWTESLAKALGCNFERRKDGEAATDEVKLSGVLPHVAIDGPFGTPSEDVFQFEVAVCVGAGIGVTPFASVLKSIWYRLQNPTATLKLRKVYFVWICREKEAFEWFSDLLDAMEQHLIETGNAEFLDARIYLTESLKADDVKNIMMHNDAATDTITGLRAKTLFGRPHWEKIFGDVADAHHGTDIGVFFCGPKILSTQLHINCNRFTNINTNTKFRYFKENF
eukprot:Opistho-2@93528